MSQTSDLFMLNRRRHPHRLQPINPSPRICDGSDDGTHVSCCRRNTAQNAKPHFPKSSAFRRHLFLLLRHRYTSRFGYTITTFPPIHVYIANERFHRSSQHGTTTSQSSSRIVEVKVEVEVCNVRGSKNISSFCFIEACYDVLCSDFWLALIDG
jgi:hypothetical protein